MSNPLLIVESPTKAKTISKFVGKDYRVLSSFGHIRDLPKSKIGVDVEHDFTPTYVVPAKSKKHVSELTEATKKAGEVYLATDEDREGEAIAWHLAQILKLDPAKTKRITFHEITAHAIEAAIKNPRHLDMNLVNAQQARRILDRLVGYELSPLLWQKVQRGLSAGRVQSVAMRLIVERERERQAFKIEEYWTIDAIFSKEKTDFTGKLAAVDGQALGKLTINNETQAKATAADLQGKKFTVAAIEKKNLTRAAPAPFTTSTLQIEANNRLGFSAKQTMQLAQRLYETGLITYMRTDSMNLAEKFLGEAQAYLMEQFGKNYATGAKQYKTKAKGAQEAHEAIRPTRADLDPTALPAGADAQARKLYDLIWRRTLASQMPAAKIQRTAVDLNSGRYTFRANGNIVTFDGFMKIYHAAKEIILPELTQGDAVTAKTISPNQHFTEPAARYSDASLVKALEEFGIGRPSTYAPTISTIIDRGYVERDDNKKLFPTNTAYVVNDLLVEHFPNVVDYKFTASMEKQLDNIAEGQEEWVPMLRDFYGPFHENIARKGKELKREDISQERELGTDPKTGLKVTVNSGPFGPYVQLGEAAEGKKPKRASLPKGMSMEIVDLEKALDWLQIPRTLGKNEAGEEIVANIGRFGPYLKAGEISVSIKPPLNPYTIGLEEAKKLMAEAIILKKKMAEPIAELGEDPTSQGKIMVRVGRYGPYVTDGTTNISVPKSIDPATVTREQAIEMLVKKRASPKRAWKRKTK